MKKLYYKGDYVMRLIEHFDLNFCLGNALKYVLRAGKKHDRIIEDLEKAKDYVIRQITHGRKTRNLIGTDNRPKEYADQAVIEFGLTNKPNLASIVESLLDEDAYNASVLNTVRILLEQEIILLKQEKEKNETGNNKSIESTN